MDRTDRIVLSLDNTSHMHQTGAVGPGNIFGSGSHVIFYFVAPHTGRYFGLFDCKHSTEAATFVHAFGLYDCNARHFLE